MKNNRGAFHAMGLMSAILSQIVGPTLIGIFFGRWLDNRYQLEPLFLILCLLTGLAIGVYAAIRSINNYFNGET